MSVCFATWSGTLKPSEYRLQSEVTECHVGWFASLILNSRKMAALSGQRIILHNTFVSSMLTEGSSVASTLTDHLS